MSQHKFHSAAAKIDVLSATAAELQGYLQNGVLNSTDLVEVYLDQIEKHNRAGFGVRAIISVAPRDILLARARELDDLRKDSKVKFKGPLYGIPVIVKDIFWTHPSLGMDTTGGSLALVGAKPPRNAAIIDRLLAAGMIILGKSNMSELSGLKNIPPCAGGWSAAGRQTLSPYVRGGVLPNATFLGHSTPAGSSSGSAAGVAAGFAPVSVASETDGSLVQPATRASLYGLKPNVGAVPNAGAMPVNPSFDSHGGMAKTPKDLADILAVLVGDDYSPALQHSWEGLSVGFVDPEPWQIPAFVTEENDGFKKQITQETEKALQIIESAGGRVVKNVKLVTLEDLGRTEGGSDADGLYSQGWSDAFEKFLQEYDESPVRTIQEMIDFNKAHADTCLPKGTKLGYDNQGGLEQRVGAKPDPDFAEKLSVIRNEARCSISQMMKDNKIDAVLGPADSRMASVASVAGYAVGTMPLGYADFNGRAWGIAIITGDGGEVQMLRVMSAWESTFGNLRKPPPMLVNWEHASL